MKFLKNILSILARIGITVLLLVFLFRQVDEQNMLRIIKSVNFGFLTLAFFIYLLVYVFCFLRWEMLLRVAKIHIPLKRTIISYAGGVFFNLFLPSTIGGDFMRSIDLAAHTKKPREVVATVLLDRLSGFVGMVTLALIALVFGWRLTQDSSVLLSIGIIVSVLVAVLLALFNQGVYSKINKFLSPAPHHAHDIKPSFFNKIRESLKNLHHEMHIFKHHKQVIINNLILSLFVQAIPPLTFYIIALSLGINVKIVYFFIFLPIIGAITLLPISIGGLGLRDATTIFFFAKAGLGKDLSFAISLLSFLFVLIYGIIGGLIYALTVRHRRIQYHK